ncbi:hypothetical protein PPTG_24881 [Phytophthora nicotianae INRA-310]|uniref:Uncharacterized protein n=1 Tax=Phytophthora nicotianae (strain INRA-310) TaxID=761204 RepID=W2PBP1_PHYN3|nr:hypothetical protein PPTG_24881 [Phytophthora nicotianae INRA-310]ETM97648.1 hypothetical protein PPTG_24881 [Phytophthora nicotianae INRA-310]
MTTERLSIARGRSSTLHACDWTGMETAVTKRWKCPGRSCRVALQQGCPVMMVDSVLTVGTAMAVIVEARAALVELDEVDLEVVIEATATELVVVVATQS